MSWRSDSNLVASVSEDGSLRLWEMENGKQVKTWAANGGGSLSVEFAPSGNIVTAGRDKVCKVWNVDGKALATCEAMPDMIMDAVLSYDSKRVIAGDWTGEGRIFDAATGKTVGKLLLNPLPLDQMVIHASQQAAEADKVAAAAAADAEGAKKGAEAAGAAAQAAVKKAADAAAEVKRLEALRPQLEKELPVKQAALKTLQQKVGDVRRALADAKGAESRAATTVKQRADALAASNAGVKKIEEEIAKLKADKKDAAVPAAQKRLDNTKAEVAQRTAQAAEVAKALADAQAKVKQLTPELAAAEQAAAKGNTDFEAHRKAIVDAGNALRALQPQLKPLQDAIAKVNAAKAAADKTAADKAAVAKTTADAAAGARQAAQRAAADKAEFDKSNNAQASAAR